MKISFVSFFIFFHNWKNVICFADDSRIDFEFVLLQYNSYLKQLVPVSFDYSIKQLTIIDDVENIYNIRQGKIHFDGTDLHRIMIHGENTSKRIAEFLICPNRNIFYEILNNDENIPSITGCTKSEHIISANMRLGELGPIFGWFYVGNEYVFLPDVLHNQDFNSDKSVQINCDLPCINGEYKGYSFDIQFDPAHSYAVHKCCVKRISTGGNVYDTDTIDFTIQSYTEQGNMIFPDRYSLSSSIMGGTVYEGNETFNVEKHKTKNDCEISNILLQRLSDSNFVLTRELPNGTNAYMIDAPQIQYVWFDGNIEPKTDKLALRIAQGGHKFIPAPNESRFWMIAAGLIMIVIALAGKRWKYCKNKNSKGSQ